MDIVERLRGPESVTLLESEAADEIERLRKANHQLAEIANDAVGWLPPASVNGPREQYQNKIKELTE